MGVLWAGPSECAWQLPLRHGADILSFLWPGQSVDNFLKLSCQRAELMCHLILPPVKEAGRTHVLTHSHTHHAHTQVHTHMYSFRYTHMHTLGRSHTFAWTHTCTRMHTHIPTHMYKFIRTHLHPSTHIHPQSFTCTLIHTSTCTHTCVHITRTHKSTQAVKPLHLHEVIPARSQTFAHTLAHTGSYTPTHSHTCTSYCLHAGWLYTVPQVRRPTPGITDWKRAVYWGFCDPKAT